MPADDFVVHRPPRVPIPVELLERSPPLLPFLRVRLRRLTRTIALTSIRRPSVVRKRVRRPIERVAQPRLGRPERRRRTNQPHSRNGGTRLDVARLHRLADASARTLLALVVVNVHDEVLRQPAPARPPSVRRSRVSRAIRRVERAAGGRRRARRRRRRRARGRRRERDLLQEAAAEAALAPHLARDGGLAARGRVGAARGREGERTRGGRAAARARARVLHRQPGAQGAAEALERRLGEPDFCPLLFALVELIARFLQFAEGEDERAAHLALLLAGGAGSLPQLERARAEFEVVRRHLPQCCAQVIVLCLYLVDVAFEEGDLLGGRLHIHAERDQLSDLNELTGGTLPLDTFRELQLPARPIIDDTPTFGLGLQSANRTIAVAFLASVGRTRPLVTSLIGSACQPALPDLRSAAQAHLLLHHDTPEGRTPALTDFDKPDAPSQRALQALVHERAWADLPKGDARSCAFRSSLALPGAKDWLRATPSPALGTYVSNRAFRAWLKFYCRLRIRAEVEGTCPRRRCNAVMDQCGDHLLTCRRAATVGAAHRTSRHNRQVRLLAQDLQLAARFPVVEPYQRAEEHSRPDIRALGRHGGNDLIDVAIVHPFCSPSLITRTTNNPVSWLGSQYKNKIERHTPLLRLQTGGAVVPIILSATGGWHPRSHEYMLTLARENNARADTHSPFYTALFFQRHAIRLLASVADSLTHPFDSYHRPLG